MGGKPVCKPRMLILTVILASWDIGSHAGKISAAPSPNSCISCAYCRKETVPSYLHASRPAFASLWTGLTQLSTFCGFRCCWVQIAEPKVMLLADSHPWPKSNGRSPVVTPKCNRIYVFLVCGYVYVVFYLIFLVLLLLLLLLRQNQLPLGDKSWTWSAEIVPQTRCYQLCFCPVAILPFGRCNLVFLQPKVAKEGGAKFTEVNITCY